MLTREHRDDMTRDCRRRVRRESATTSRGFAGGMAVHPPIKLQLGEPNSTTDFKPPRTVATADELLEVLWVESDIVRRLGHCKVALGRGVKGGGAHGLFYPSP